MLRLTRSLLAAQQFQGVRVVNLITSCTCYEQFVTVANDCILILIVALVVLQRNDNQRIDSCITDILFLSIQQSVALEVDSCHHGSCITLLASILVCISVVAYNIQVWSR